MATDIIEVGQGDANVDVDLFVFDEHGGPLNLSQSTAKLYYRRVGETTLVATINCTFPNGGVEEVVNGNNRVRVRATLPAECMEDTGRYEGQLEITTGPRVQTIKRKKRFKVFPQF